MIELKGNKLLVTAIVTDMEAGEIVGLMLGNTLFEKKGTLNIPLPEVTEAPDQGEPIVKYYGSWVKKNVLDACRHAKTWAEMEGVIRRFYPNASSEASIRTYVRLYKNALKRGVPSVPVKEITHSKKKQTIVKATKGKRKPAEAQFFDKVSHVWILASEYAMVREHVLAQERIVMRDVLRFFGGRLKPYRVSAVFRRLIDEGMLQKRSGGEHIWFYIPVRPVEKTMVEIPGVFPESILK